MDNDRPTTEEIAKSKTDPAFILKRELRYPLLNTERLFNNARSFKLAHHLLHRIDNCRISSSNKLFLDLFKLAAETQINTPFYSLL